MSFGELFEHLKLYISSPEQRWKYCMRVKRVNTSKNGCGGYGRDQCYFEGQRDWVYLITIVFLYITVGSLHTYILMGKNFDLVVL